MSRFIKKLAEKHRQNQKNSLKDMAEKADATKKEDLETKEKATDEQQERKKEKGDVFAKLLGKFREGYNAHHKQKMPDISFIKLPHLNKE